MDPRVIEIPAKHGAYLGIFMCVFTLFMWITELDTIHYDIGKTIELLVSIVPVAVILYTILKLNQQVELTVKKRILAGLTVGLVSVLISTPFTEIYHNFINPEWFDAVLKLKEQSMTESGASQADIHTRLEQMKAGNTTLNSVLGAIAFGGIIFPVAVSLVSFLFIRNKKTEEPENEYSL